MKTTFFSLMFLATFVASLTVASPVPGCGAVSNAEVAPVVPIRYIIGLGKRFRDDDGGDAKSGDSGDADGGDVHSDSGGGDQHNIDSSMLPFPRCDSYLLGALTRPYCRLRWQRR